MPSVLFTRETAAEYGRKGTETQRRERQASLEQAELLKQAIEIVRKTAAQAQNSSEVVDYRSIRLARVRAHLDRLDDMFAIEKDPQRLSQLAQAMDKVSEQERLLAGRPAPKAEESKRHQVRQGAKNSEQAAADRQDQATEG